MLIVFSVRLTVVAIVACAGGGVLSLLGLFLVSWDHDVVLEDVIWVRIPEESLRGVRARRCHFI